MTDTKVLKNFSYSLNGIKSHQAFVGVTPDPDIPADLVEALVAEGYISVDGAPENKMIDPVTSVGLPFKLAKKVPEIDDDADSETYWRKLSAPEMKLLAGQISDEAINNKADAEAAIEIHLESLEQS